MKKLYIFINMQNYVLSKMVNNPDIHKKLSAMYSEAALNRMPVIYFQQWQSELDNVGIIRNTYDSDIVSFIYPSNPFFVESEILYNFSLPIGNRNIVIRHGEYKNTNTLNIIENLLNNSKLELEEIHIACFDTKQDSNYRFIENIVKDNNKIKIVDCL